MQLPRFLWVPFELGRPFGAPNESMFQKRVLRSALELLERTDGPVVLEDFQEDAPVPPPARGNEGLWACPVSFPPPREDRPQLVSATLEEMRHLEPWYELHLAARGVASPPVSGLERSDIVAGLGEIAEGVLEPAVQTNHTLVEWIRLGCDDLRNWYLDAAQGQPGHASARELHDWFWRQTAAARLIARAARSMAGHSDPMAKMLALRAMVPREHLEELIPEFGKLSWSEK